jgi:hypothetical protein
MELGCDAVMINTAIAKSRDPRSHGGSDARRGRVRPPSRDWPGASRGATSPSRRVRSSG